MTLRLRWWAWLGSCALAFGCGGSEPVEPTTPAPTPMAEVRTEVSEPAEPVTPVAEVTDLAAVQVPPARFQAALAEAGAAESAVAAGPTTLPDGRAVAVSAFAVGEEVAIEVTIGSASEDGVGPLTRVPLAVLGERMLFAAGMELRLMDESGGDVITAFEVRDVDEDGVLEALVTTNINGPQGDDGYAHFEGYFVVELGTTPRVQISIPELSRRHDSESVPILEGRYFHVGSGGALERRVCPVSNGTRTCPDEWERTEVEGDVTGAAPTSMPVSEEGRAILDA